MFKSMPDSLAYVGSLDFNTRTHLLGDFASALSLERPRNKHPQALFIHWFEGPILQARDLSFHLCKPLWPTTSMMWVLQVSSYFKMLIVFVVLVQRYLGSLAPSPLDAS